MAVLCAAFCPLGQTSLENLYSLGKYRRILSTAATVALLRVDCCGPKEVAKDDGSGC